MVLPEGASNSITIPLPETEKKKQNNSKTKEKHIKRRPKKIQKKAPLKAGVT
jgi:hypothetical protein